MDICNGSNKLRSLDALCSFRSSEYLTVSAIDGNSGCRSQQQEQ
jgi:hypothetical protein